MKSAFRKRLSFRLTRDTVLLAMLLGFILNMVQVTLDYFHARQAMDGEIQALIEISHSPASQIAYNIDTRLAEELLDGLLKHPAIVDARIVDPENRILAASSKSSADSDYRWLSDLLFGSSRSYSDHLQVPQLAEVPLGELAITIDTYYYGNEFLNRAGYTLLSGFLKSLVLSIMLLFVFYFVLTKPMLRVIAALGEVEPKTPEKARLPIPPSHEEDEIGTMVEIINQHLDTIDSSLNQLRAAEATMKNYSSQLEREVEARTREISDKNEALQSGNRALVRAKEDAVRRAHARASFLANMSHEIRTPLNGVLGMLSLSLEGELRPDQRNRLQIALTAGQSLLELLNDILDISKVEAGKLHMESIPFSVRTLVEECSALLAQHAPQEQIDLVVDIDPALPDHFIGDPTRTRQVINNLLGNAIKFTNVGEVRIQVRYVDREIRLDIIDTGIGMSAEGLRRIFSPFAQADADTTRRYGGTGLGLTLCRQLVERMHGHIRVNSEPNKGTQFTVTLPFPVAGDEVTTLPPVPEVLLRRGVTLALSHAHPHRLPLERQLKAWRIPVRDRVADADPETPADGGAAALTELVAGKLPDALSDWPADRIIALARHGQEVADASWQHLPLPIQRHTLLNCLRQAVGEIEPGDAPENADAGPVSPLRSLRLLLVEDNRVNQIVASAILRKLGFTVDLAENGERALAALEQAHYDMVLMDCQMPVMDGYEATRRIRRRPEWQSLPVIAVTANVMQGDKDECLAAGMNDYITKPYDRKDLIRVIERWSDQTGQGT